MVAKYQYYVDQGVVNVETSELLTDVQNEWKDTLGEDLIVKSSSIQGTLIESEAVARAAVMKNNADQANLLNPDQSHGVALDSICAFTGVDREEDAYTVGNGIECTGNPNVVIKSGSRLIDQNSTTWIVTGDSTIDSGRQATISVRAENPGPIPLGIQTLTIVDGIIGWGDAKVTTNTAVTVGQLALSDGQLKVRRKQTMFAQGMSSVGAIISRLYKVPGVFSVKVVENTSGQATGTVDDIKFSLIDGVYICCCGPQGVPLAPNAYPEIGMALCLARSGLLRYDEGITASGTKQAVIVTEPYSFQRFTVAYYNPTVLYAHMKIDATYGTNSSATEVAMARKVMEAVEGKLDYIPGFAIGKDISGYELGSMLMREFPGVFIKSFEIALAPNATTQPAPSEFAAIKELKNYEFAAVAVGNVNVVLSPQT